MKIATAYLEKALKWPQIKAEDSKGMNPNFLSDSENVEETRPLIFIDLNAQILNDPLFGDIHIQSIPMSNFEFDAQLQSMSYELKFIFAAI